MTRHSGRPGAPLRHGRLLGALVVALVALAAVLGTVSGGGASSASVSRGAPAGCTVEVRSLAAAAGALHGGARGSVVCLAGGSYAGTLKLAAGSGRPVTLRGAPGATVRTGPVAITGGGIVVEDLWINGEVSLAAGVSGVALRHNDITGGGEGVVFDTSDCTVPNSPTWPGCEPQGPVSNVTISGNHFHNIGLGGGEDAIHLDNWRNVTVSGNEFDHIVEAGNHTDCLQSVYGGTNLTFTRNYEHDNNCQGIFIKDGDATNVTVSDNLFLRDAIGQYANFAQIWNTQGLVFQRNTIWDGKGLALVADNASFLPSAKIDHNLLAHFALEPPAGSPYSLTEASNLFGAAPSGLRPSGRDHVSARPRFRNPRRGDYRLANGRAAIGIDWVPALQAYGPTG